MEYWDAYDRNINKIKNKTLVRGEPIPDGIYHLVCDIAVRHIDGAYLLMQRDFNKHLGGLWEFTAGGSAWRGETPLECAIRELKEETGISVGELKKLGTVVDDERHSIYFEYLCTTDCDKNSISLQKGETINYRWADENFIKNEKLTSTRILKFIF